MGVSFEGAPGFPLDRGPFVGAQMKLSKHRGRMRSKPPTTFFRAWAPVVNFKGLTPFPFFSTRLLFKKPDLFPTGSGFWMVS